MSVYIKGMEMPTNCGDCCFYREDDFEWCCRANYEICDGLVDRNGRPDWCGLVPVPPHGRLIGENDVLKKFDKAMSDFGRGKIEAFDFTCKAREAIVTAPTIIPADKEAGE